MDATNPTPTPGSIASDAKYDLLQPGVTRYRYIIYSQRRTGSNWLCSRLSQTGTLGVPGEYLERSDIRNLATRLLGLPPGKIENLPMSTYMQALERVRTTPNGKFGIKSQPDILPRFFPKPDAMAGFLRSFDAIVMMTRRDLLSQAVSSAIADMTRVWWNDGQEPDLSGINLEELLYETAFNVGRFVREWRIMKAMAAKSGRPTLLIEYEDIEHEPEAVFARVVRFLGEDPERQNPSAGVNATAPRRPPGIVAGQVRAAAEKFIQGERNLDLLFPGGVARP